MELLEQRYKAMRPALAERLLDGRDPGGIRRARGVGDAHLHAESVTRLETEAGYTLYYKPRDCRSTLLLGEICRALFARRCVPEQLGGEGFAFQRAVVPGIPEVREEAVRYYTWLGRLTAVFYALGSTDMHRTNVLCEHGFPVVIDTETLLCAKAEGFGGGGEFSAEYGKVFPEYLCSVGECMVLPRFYGMAQHSPLLPGGSCTPEGHETDFIGGFIDGYRTVQKNSESLFLLLDRFADMPIRCLLRSTGSYSITRLKYAMAQGAEAQEAALKGLEKGLSEKDLARWAPVLDWERACIREGDVPYFRLLAGERSLYGERAREPLIPSFLPISPLESAKRRIARLSEEDLAVQCAYIRASLRHIDGWAFDERQEEITAATEPLSAEDAVSEVCEALDRLWEERIPLSDGKCLWHIPLTNGKGGCLFSLADGFSGIGVFAGACADSPLITGVAAEKAAALCDACVRDMLCFGEYLLDSCPDAPEERSLYRRFNAGADPKRGVSGLLWALRRSRCSKSDRAERIIRGLEAWGPESENPLAELESGDKTDLLDGGRAGAVMALLDDGAWEQAGCLLKDMRMRKQRRGCFQVFPAGRVQYFLPSFLNGSAGIAYAFLRYAERLTDAPRSERRSRTAAV